MSHQSQPDPFSEHLRNQFSSPDVTKPEKTGQSRKYLAIGLTVFVALLTALILWKTGAIGRIATSGTGNSAPSTLSQNDAIQWIKDRYYATTSRKGLSSDKYEWDGEAEKMGGRIPRKSGGPAIEFIHKKGDVKMVIVDDWLGDGGSHTEYCFENGKPYFIYDRHDMQTFSEESTSEYRHYIYNNQLIQCKDGQTVVPCKQADYLGLVGDAQRAKDLFPGN